MAVGDQPRGWTSSAVRFVVAGGLNTLATGALLSVLAHFIDPRIAYALAFAVGIAISLMLAGGFVFGVRLTRRTAALYVAMYLAVFCIGLLVIDIAMRWGLTRDASGLVVLVTAPLTFLGGRTLLVRPHGLDARADRK